MDPSLVFTQHDLVTPDGMITSIFNQVENRLEAFVEIQDISPAFVGFKIAIEYIQFNIKSTLAQLGVHGKEKCITLYPHKHSATIHVELHAIGPIAEQLLCLLSPGCFIGKLFAADPDRRVRDPDYLLRMFTRQDRDGLPLLSLGYAQDSKALKFEKINGYTVAFLKLKEGVLTYRPSIEGFLPTLAYALKFPNLQLRTLLILHQEWQKKAERKPQKDRLLLVKTLPLHVRTVFAKIAEDFLPKGIFHTSANILQPDTKASGDIYEFYGTSEKELTEIPLEFYTLEPYREHIFFADKDQLQNTLENPQALFKAFETAPKDPAIHSAIFIVKSEQLRNLTAQDWVNRHIHPEQFPGLFDLGRQSQMVQEHIQKQPSYPFLKAIESGFITSQGVLLTRYFPSPLMKKMLLGDLVQSSLRGLYFQIPSQLHGNYFSHEDRSLLIDLAKFAIPVFWVDKTCGKILQFAPKPEKDTGMFVPIDSFEKFVHSTVFGVYGSTLIELLFEEELTKILKGILAMQNTLHHHLLNKDTPISLITGGGPGLMEVGNRVAHKLGILSCANIVDFSGIEQEQNMYIDAKMTYRLDRLVERQGEFNLDFPIFLMGGYGTDFEFALEGVRRKVGSGEEVTPVLLLGPAFYWKEKITSAYQANLQNGTITHSEWVSNCFYCVETAEQALRVYRDFFEGALPIGKLSPSSSMGFMDYTFTL